MDATQIDVCRRFAIGENLHEVFGTSFDDAQVANAIEVAVLNGGLPSTCSFATALFNYMIHDVLPCAGVEIRIDAGKVNTSQGRIEQRLVNGVVIGLGEALGLGFVASLERLVPHRFLVDEVINPGLAAKESKLNLHRAQK